MARHTRLLPPHATVCCQWLTSRKSAVLSSRSWTMLRACHKFPSISLRVYRSSIALTGIDTSVHALVNLNQIRKQSRAAQSLLTCSNLRTVLSTTCAFWLRPLQGNLQGAVETPAFISRHLCTVQQQQIVLAMTKQLCQTVHSLRLTQGWDCGSDSWPTSPAVLLLIWRKIVLACCPS